MVLSLATQKANAQTVTVASNSKIGTNDGATINAMVTDGTSTYIGGNFSEIYRFGGSGASISTTTALADQAFPNVLGVVTASVPDGSGGWFIGGSFTFVAGNARNGLAHINSDGTLDMTWNPNVTGLTARVMTIVISGSNLYVGGQFSAVGGQTRNCLAKISTTGAGLSDATWNPAMSAGGSDQIRSIILNGTDLYVGGLFTSIGGQTRNNLAKIATTGTGAADATWNPNINALVGSLLVVGTDIYVGGFFAGTNSVNGTTTRNNIAKISTTGAGLVDATWNPNPTVTSGSVDITAFATDGTDLFVGGYFEAIGGQTRQHLAKLSLTGTGSADATWFPIPSSLSGTSFRVSGLIVSGTQVYVSGDFNQMNTDFTQGLCRLSTTGVGAVDATWDAKVAPFVKSITLSGTNLYVGLDYNVAAGATRLGFNAVTRQGLAKIDNATGNLDMTWNPNISAGGVGTGLISALALSGTNLFIGGIFTTVGGTAKTNIAKISTSGTGALSASWTNSVNNTPGISPINTMVIDGTSLYVGGKFTLASGQTRNNVAKFSTTDLTTVDGTWNPNANNTVNAIAVSGTDVFIGGAFTTINGATSRNFLAKCTTTNSTVDATWNPAPNAAVLALTVEGTNIYVGGLFASNPPTNSTISIGGAARNNIARLSMTGTGAADSFGAGAGAIGTGGIRQIILGQNSVYATGVADDIYRLRKNSNPFIDTNFKLVIVSGYTSSMSLSGDILTVAGIFQIVRNTAATYQYLTYDFANLSVNPDISNDAAFATFSGCVGTASTHQSFIVYGNHLTANVTLTAPANFEISIDGGASYNTTQIITQTSGSIPNTTVRVRISSASTAGFGSANLAITSGTITVNVALTYNLTTKPTITLGTVSSVSTSATSFSLPFSASTGSPTTYSITAVAPNAMPSFVNVVNATFTGISPIAVPIPASLAGVYNFEMIVSTATCSSVIMPFTLTVTGPTISVTSTMTAFTGCEGVFVRPTKSYTVTGSNLTANIVITAPAGFEIKDAANLMGMFGSTVTLTPSAGTVNATINVQYTQAAAGSPLGNITHTSTGAGIQNVAVSATLTPAPTVTIGTVSTVLTSATSFIIPYTATTNSPNQYSVFASGPTSMAGFTNVTNQVLSGTSGNITVTIPASAANTYNFALEVINTTTGCSGGITFTVTVAATLPPCTLYVRKDGSDANNGVADNSAGAKLTLQAAMNSIPDGCTIILNTGIYNETATLTGKSITLQSVGNPTVQTINMNGAAKTITLTGAIGISEILNLQAGDVASNGNLTLLSTATKQAMLINTGTSTVTGDVTIQRYFRTNTVIHSNATSGSAYRHIASPVTNANFTQITDNFSIVVNAAYNTSNRPGRVRPYPTIYAYNPLEAGNPTKIVSGSNPEFDKGWQSPLSLTSAMLVGTGYTVIAPGNIVLDITGTLNNSPASNITLPIYPASSSMNGSASLGWNFIGNPYPSPISWDAVRGLSTGLDDAIYLYTATSTYSGLFATRVPSTGISSPAGAVTDDIAVMQGFIVKANAIGNVVMNNTVRSTTYKNPNSFRSEDNNLVAAQEKIQEKHQGIIRLKMTNTSKEADETVVYFIDKATENYDRKYDAVKFKLNEGNVPSFFSTYNKENYAINALQNLKDDTTIPLTVNVTSEGKQSISLLEQAGFNRKVELYLLDNATNTHYDLSKGVFEFTAASGLIENRFFLIAKPQFTAAELNGDNLNLYPNPSSETLNISIGDDYKGELTLRLTDVSGREVWTAKAEKTGKIYENSVNIENLASGTYILEVSGAKKMVKKVMKQ